MRSCLWLVLLLCACSDPTYDLLVDLNTDLRPRLDFEHIRVSILEAPDPSLVGEQDDFVPAADDDFLTFPGRRVAEFLSLPSGDYVIEVRLLDADGVTVVARVLRIGLTASRVVRVRITSDCLSVVCPGADDSADRTECLGGRCVPPGCTADDPSSCGTPGCFEDAQCGASATCAEGRCVLGECLVTPNDALCTDREYCDIADGCSERPAVPSDAGVDAGDPGADAGTDAGVDGGPTCTPATCDDFDPCTTDRCVGGSCTSTPLCGGTDYCRSGVCEPTPTFLLETVGASGCADLGVAHPSGSDFLFRRTITGRARATAQQYNRQISCGTPTVPAESFVLDGSGRAQDSFYTTPLTECWDGIYGRWRAYVDVDGVRSNTQEVVYYNSSCSNVRTCSAARSFCSPCRDCDLATGYCYGGTTCAPDPTLSITTSEGGGCVDLGVPHTSPPALAIVITGRPNATSTQMNEHVSCALAEVPAEVRPLDASGRATSELTTGAAACSGTVWGRWSVTVDVDGERSNAQTVVYFNSSCPGYDTCALARNYCPPGA